MDEDQLMKLPFLPWLLPARWPVFWNQQEQIEGELPAKPWEISQTGWFTFSLWMEVPLRNKIKKNIITFDSKICLQFEDTHTALVVVCGITNLSTLYKALIFTHVKTQLNLISCSKLVKVGLWQNHDNLKTLEWPWSYHTNEFCLTYITSMTHLIHLINIGTVVHFDSILNSPAAANTHLTYSKYKQTIRNQILKT